MTRRRPDDGRRAEVVHAAYRDLRSARALRRATDRGRSSMIWHQNYDPLGSWPLSTFVSALPVVTLFLVLLVGKSRVWVAAAAGLAVAFALALTVFGMPPSMAVAACGQGFIFGFLRIAWIIISS